MKSFAVFCPIKGENIFTKTWCKYYSQFTPNVFFLDFNVNKRNIYDAQELFSTIKDYHKKLLEDFEYVIPTDVDEIIYTKHGLDVYINKLAYPDVKCNGFEIIHLPDKEPDIDWEKPLLEQRKYWYQSNIHYAKTLITNHPLNWSIGLHRCQDGCGIFDPDLYLIHLHRIDYKTTIQKHLDYAKLPWSENTRRNNFNWHYRLTAIPEINEWYYHTYGKIVEIPDEIRQVKV